MCYHCAYWSIFPRLERPFFQSCQNTKIGSVFSVFGNYWDALKPLTGSSSCLRYEWMECILLLMFCSGDLLPLQLPLGHFTLVLLLLQLIYSVSQFILLFCFVFCTLRWLSKGEAVAPSQKRKMKTTILFCLHFFCHYVVASCFFSDLHIFWLHSFCCICLTPIIYFSICS